MRILFVDKDNIWDELQEDSNDEYVVDLAANGSQASVLYEVNSYDALVVDYSSSDFDLLDVCNEKSFDRPPIAVLLDESTTDFQIRFYEMGVDRILHKPITYPLFDAVIRSMVFKDKVGSAYVYHSQNGLSINFKNREVFLNGNILELRKKEYDILEYLIINRERVVSKEQLIEHVWNIDTYVYSNTVEVHISNIRDRIDQSKIPKIKTIRGFGYQFIE